MTTETIGVIKKFNHNPGKMPGIYVELDDGTSQWFNATLQTQEYMKGMANAVGRTVQITHDKGRVTFIKTMPGEVQAKPETQPLITPVGASALNLALSKDAMIVRQTCIKTVAEIVKVDPDLQDENKFIERCKRLEAYVVKGK